MAHRFRRATLQTRRFLPFWLYLQPFFQEQVMTSSQRLKYSVLISLVVLGIMFGLSYLQNAGMISEKVFQYVAIGVAVVVVVINGVMRRKTKI